MAFMELEVFSRVQEPANESQVAVMFEKLNAYKSLYDEREGQRPIGIPRIR
jgi:hypothetical protein